MINLIGALTLTAKLAICIAVFVVLIVVEILALVMLARWKKNFKNSAVQNEQNDKQNVVNIVDENLETKESQSAQQDVVAATADTQEVEAENVDDGALADEDSPLPEDGETAVNAQEETTQAEADDVAQETAAEEDKADIKQNDNKWSAFAFAPFMFLSAGLPVTSLRYVLYALIGVSVVLAVAVIATAAIFAKSLTKSKQEQPVKEEPKPQQEQPTPKVEEPQEQIAEDEVMAEEAEQELADEPVEEVAQEHPEETVEEEQPVEETPIVEEVVEEVVEEQQPEEAIEEEQQVEPAPEPKPHVKRAPAPKEQTMVMDDQVLIIKDDRFLFNPADDGYHYVLIKTFTAKLIQADEYVKDYYTELKNELLSYKKVHARMSKKRESFNFGRTCLARMTIRGKTLRLHLALDAKDYEESKYKVEDTSNVKSLADTPLMYRIKNDRRLKYAKDLIATLMAKVGAEKQEIEPVDYTSMYPYEETPPLIERGLITRRRTAGKVPEGNGFDFAQKTFKAKLIQAEDFVKEYYSQLKNALLSYRKVHDRMSKKRESFRFGRTCVARMTIRGKTLRLYLALNPADFVDTKYKFDDASEVKSVADTPLLIKLKNNRRLKYALELIDMAMANVGATKKRESDETDYAADLPFESLEELMEKGLVTNVHVEGNSFVAQHFSFKAKDEDEAAADEDDE